MSNITPGGPPIEVHALESGRPISFLWLYGNRKVARVLTGYAARIHFWQANGTVHIDPRFARVDGPNGLTTYDLTGDEFPDPGAANVMDVLAQFEVMPPDWYLGGAVATSFLRTYSSLFRFRVHKRPA
jgi:hypothetical protein